MALQQLFMMPLNYVREHRCRVATSLAVFLPLLDETSFLARFLGSIDLFRIWWLVNLAIGLGVLYKRSERARSRRRCSALYVVIALVVAAVRRRSSGA